MFDFSFFSRVLLWPTSTSTTYYYISTTTRRCLTKNFVFLIENKFYQLHIFHFIFMGCHYDPTQTIIPQSIIKCIFIYFERVTLTHICHFTNQASNEQSRRLKWRLLGEGQKRMQTFYWIHILSQTHTLTLWKYFEKQHDMQTSPYTNVCMYAKPSLLQSVYKVTFIYNYLPAYKSNKLWR